MQSFRYAVARSFAEAAGLLTADAQPLAGGTDLVPLMQERLVQPRLLVDLRRIARGSEVAVAQRDGASIGALALLADLAGHPGLRRLYPAFVQACSQVGTPQLRHMATLAGNLCQRPRCWYYRMGTACRKSGGSTCPAVEGKNEYLAVLGGGPCWAAHPSDPAVALTALEARVVVRRQGRDGTEVPLDELYTDAASNMRREVALEPGDLIERVVLPPQLAGVRQAYVKITQRWAFDFALVSVAVVWPRRTRRPAIVLGGVAPRPWRIDPAGLPPAPRTRARPETVELWTANVADQALKGAKPLSENGYKVAMAKAAVRKALIETLPKR